MADPGNSTATARPAVPPWRSLGSRILREPLTHFIVIGAVLFAISSAEGSSQPDGAGDTIVITTGDMQQMLVSWLAQGRAKPTPEQWHAMIEQKIHEQVLYREALAMGLDKGDVIVTRRLAQKMDFLAEDLSALRQPTEADLQAWLAEHPDEFAMPPRISFHHVYFSFDQHGAGTEAVAAAALTSGTPPLGDRFMFQDSYGDRTPEEVASVFGPAFAEAIFDLPAGQWSKPVESGFGWHLVYVDDLAKGRVADLSEIEEQVTASWVAAQREEFKAEAYEVMRAKYHVVLPDLNAAETNGEGS